jgi:5-methylcytosine-specific restriction endonuclease McrA
MGKSDYIEKLFAYNPRTRGLKKGADYGIGLDVADFEELSERIGEIFFSSPLFDEEVVVREIGELLRYRLIFVMLPEECLYGAPVEDKPVISAHLESLGIEPNENIVRAVKYFCENFRSKKDVGNRAKFGITDVYIKFPHIYSSIMSEQGGRCRTCGAQLVYGENMQLDHILPYYLGDDPPDGTNWQFLCDLCNRGKGGDPYYSLSKLMSNWIGPNTRNELTDSLRYAALERDKKCKITGVKPGEMELGVKKKILGGCWVLDNVISVDKKLL